MFAPISRDYFHTKRFLQCAASFRGRSGFGDQVFECLVLTSGNFSPFPVHHTSVVL